MLKLKTMFKAMRGFTSLDEILDGCKEMGMDVSVTPVPVDVKPATSELEQLIGAAIGQGAKFIKVDWKSGEDSAVAFVVLKQGVIKTS